MSEKKKSIIKVPEAEKVNTHSLNGITDLKPGAKNGQGGQGGKSTTQSSSSSGKSSDK